MQKCIIHQFYAQDNVNSKTTQNFANSQTAQNFVNSQTKQNLWDSLIMHPIKRKPKCTVDRFTKTFFWNFQNIQAVLCYILIDKQMLEKAFCSNIAPSLSSGTHLFYKAEYMGRSCLNQVWALAFDWGALTTWNKHSWNAFRKLARFWLYNRYQAHTPGTFISRC